MLISKCFALLFADLFSIQSMTRRTTSVSVALSVLPLGQSLLLGTLGMTTAVVLPTSAAVATSDAFNTNSTKCGDDWVLIFKGRGSFRQWAKREADMNGYKVLRETTSDICDHWELWAYDCNIPLKSQLLFDTRDTVLNPYGGNSAAGYSRQVKWVQESMTERSWRFACGLPDKSNFNLY